MKKQNINLLQKYVGWMIQEHYGSSVQCVSSKAPAISFQRGLRSQRGQLSVEIGF